MISGATSLSKVCVLDIAPTNIPSNVTEGASCYYMRNILHDYPDDRCVTLLRKTMAAMSKDSVILIDEMILPDLGTYWQAAQLDISMMSSLASMERSEEQWYKLLDMAGLQIRKIYTYTTELRDSIIVAAPQ